MRIGWRESVCCERQAVWRKIGRYNRCVGDYDPSRGIVPVVLQNGGLTN